MKSTAINLIHIFPEEKESDSHAKHQSRFETIIISIKIFLISNQWNKFLIRFCDTTIISKKNTSKNITRVYLKRFANKSQTAIATNWND